MTDAAGETLATWTYDEWGAVRDSSVATTSLVADMTLAQHLADLQVLRYAGYAYDAESGLYYCSARYLDPKTAQFLSRDPAEADGQESAYQYCGGDPVGRVDPSGEWGADLHGHHIRGFARLAGFSFNQWQAVAAGDLWVDNRRGWGWDPSHHWALAGATSWSNRHYRLAVLYWDAGDYGGGLFQLGEALHSAQDAIGHGTGFRHPPGIDDFDRALARGETRATRTIGRSMEMLASFKWSVDVWRSTRY